MSPVLLDHRNLKWIWLSIALLVVMTFFGGYILGFEKSNNTWLAKLDPVEIALPEALVSELTAVEAQAPDHEEPGASIDVDSADSEDSVVDKKTAAAPVPLVAEVINDEVVEAEPVELAQPEVAEKTIEADAPALDSAEDAEMTQLPSGVGGPPKSRPEVELLSDQTTETLSIVDDATEETASHSIQIGMYSSFDNAAAKVEQLLDLDLNAYLNDYQNKNDETRFNVRFGYFGSFSSGQRALKIYQQTHLASGYVVRLRR